MNNHTFRVQFRNHHLPLILTVILLFFVSLSLASPQASAEASIPPGTDITPVIAKYRALIPKLMAEKKIPGLAVAVTTEQQILWSQGFGYTDWDRRIKVTSETIFSIQSMSKTFTASAAMIAVQAGLVDLETPISQYLPNFTVHSVFEEHPETKITLKNLLNHTAGFTHEAPLGNNYLIDSSTFEEHIQSISNTWLKFPVGANYAYSNLGIDLAGYILQVRSGKSFPQYLQEILLNPIGMHTSSFDMNVIQHNSNRAIGHDNYHLHVPLKVPMIPAGGLYSNVNDMARFLQFHLNQGKAKDAQLLTPERLNEMYNSQLGIGLGINLNTYYLAHGGGGFGFLSEMIWYPQLKIGIVVLTNSANHDIQWKLPNDILNEIINTPGNIFYQRMNGPDVNSSSLLAGRENLPPEPNNTWRFAELKPLAEYPGWLDKYSGFYFYKVWNQFAGTYNIHPANGSLYLDGEELTELKLGLFFTKSGEALDLRANPPTYRNIRLVKPHLLLWAVILSLTILIFLSALIVWLVRIIRLLIPRRKSPTLSAENQVMRRSFTWIAQTLANLSSLGGLIFLGFLALKILVGLPASSDGITLADTIILTIPKGMLGLTPVLAIAAIFIFQTKSWTSWRRIHYLLILLATIFFLAFTKYWGF